MDRTIAGLAWNICLYYLDDIIVFSSTWAEHLERLRAVFERLRRANLKLGARKCHLATREVSFLGYRVTPEGLKPEPRLMEAISKLPPPINPSVPVLIYSDMSENVQSFKRKREREKERERR